MTEKQLIKILQRGKESAEEYQDLDFFRGRLSAFEFILNALSASPLK